MPGDGVSSVDIERDIGPFTPESVGVAHDYTSQQ
jgi:hypothetical protein